MPVWWSVTDLPFVPFMLQSLMNCHLPVAFNHYVSDFPDSCNLVLSYTDNFTTVLFSSDVKAAGTSVRAHFDKVALARPSTFP